MCVTCVFFLPWHLSVCLSVYLSTYLFPSFFLPFFFLPSFLSFFLSFLLLLFFLFLFFFLLLLFLFLLLFFLFLLFLLLLFLLLFLLLRFSLAWNSQVDQAVYSASLGVSISVSPVLRFQAHFTMDFLTVGSEDLTGILMLARQPLHWLSYLSSIFFLSV